MTQAISCGPLCRRCSRTEQECAHTYPCCEACSHRFGEVTSRPRRERQYELVLVRCSDPKAGTDTGYYRHVRQHRTKPCRACREAHAAAERRRAQRKVFGSPVGSVGEETG